MMQMKAFSLSSGSTDIIRFIIIRILIVPKGGKEINILIDNYEKENRINIYPCIHKDIE